MNYALSFRWDGSVFSVLQVVIVKYARPSSGRMVVKYALSLMAGW